MAAPRRRRTNYRPARRTTRRPRYGLFSPPVILTAAVLAAIGAPTIGVPILALAVAGLWFMRPARQRRTLRTPRRPAALNRPRSASIAGYHAMTPNQFEHALADLCRRDGCTNVRVVGGANDHGADVIATIPDGRRLVIQAKRYGPKKPVRSDAVQIVNGTYKAFHHAQLAAIVTTSRFTKDALATAAQVHIRMYDHHRLANWAAGTGPAPWH